MAMASGKSAALVSRVALAPLLSALVAACGADLFG